MDVLLIRHAEAGERDDAQWPDDDLRPVSDEGREKQTTCARAMKKLGVKFEYLVTSPLLRARETAAILAEVYGYQDEPQVSEALGHGCAAGTVVELLAKFPPHGRVALVGHEPAFSRVAAALIGGPDADITLKKSGVVGIAFDGPADVGAGSLAFLLKPGQMRRLTR